VDATLEPEQIEHAVEAIGAEVEQIRALGPSSVELERARVNVLAHEVHEKEAVQGQARKLGYYEMLGGGLEAEQEYLDRVRAATTEDLRRVAVEYLRPERATLVALVPEAARDDLAPETLTAALERGVRPAAQLAAEPLTEDIRRYTLPNGLRVIVKRNDAVPLVAMRLAFLGGQLAETEPTQGISSFLAEMLERGTEQRSSAQIAAEVENIAGALGGFSGRNTFGVTAQFLSETLDTGLDLFTDVVLHPGFPAREIEKLREERIAAIRRLEDNLGSKAFELFADALFVDHPYRFRSIGTEESVKRIDRDALLDYWGRFAHPSNGVLSVVGDTDPDRVVQALSLRFAAWTGPESVRLPERTPPAPPAKPVEVSVEKNKQQVHIVMGFPGLALDDPDGAALEVLTQVLSGQGGRLFLELRDRRSLAYSVSAFSIEGLDPGSFGVYIASAPDKLEESLEGLRAELARLLDGPISGEEISRAQAYLIGSHAISLQRYAAHATGLALNELYSLGATHYLEYASRIEAVTEQDLRRVAARVILLDRPVVAVVR
jgi:zinc protease